MPSWFKKVFTSGAARPTPRPTYEKPESDEAGVEPFDKKTFTNPILDEDDVPAEPSGVRKVVNPPVLVSEEESSGWSEEIRIKARPEDNGMCTFLVDRPVFEKHSAWFPNHRGVDELSPLASAIFKVDGVLSVLIHDTTVTVTRKDSSRLPWLPMAKQIGSIVREHLKTGKPVMSEAFLESLPPEETIRSKVQQVIDMEVNPGIAAHSGVIALERVEGNTVYITMGGGCQGCAASTITLRQGIHTAFRRAVPQIGAILDETDHATGANPYFKELPESMRAHA